MKPQLLPNLNFRTILSILTTKREEIDPMNWKLVPVEYHSTCKPPCSGPCNIILR